MTTVRITLCIDNAAFEGADAGPEFARILRGIADTYAPYDAHDFLLDREDGSVCSVKDVNGNTVGRIFVTE